MGLWDLDREILAVDLGHMMFKGTYGTREMEMTGLSTAEHRGSTGKGDGRPG
jgi:hypothetical protein